MAMWTDILGGLGAAGGGYAQALEKIKAQKLDEKTQADLKKYRDEESKRRTDEEQARIQADLDRDVIEADRYTADQLAQVERDAATARERELALQFRIDEAQRDADAAALTQNYRSDVLAAAERDRPPENHAIVAARQALELTKSDDGAWNPRAAQNMLVEGHQNDGESEEFIRALNWVLVQEQEQAQEQRPELDPAEVFNMPADLQREYYLGGAGQQINWGDTTPSPIMGPEGLPFTSEQEEHGGRIPGEDPMPGTSFIPQGTSFIPQGATGIPQGATGAVPTAGTPTPRTPSTAHQLGRTNPRVRSALQGAGPTNYGNRFNQNTPTATTGVSAPTPGDTTISREEAQRQLDELRRLIPGT